MGGVEPRRGAAMDKRSRRVLVLALGAFVLAASACAHAPAAGADERPAPGQQHEKVLVTGSRIPRRVDTSSGLPATAWPVRIYSRNDLTGTGRPETADALRRLDPSIP